MITSTEISGLADLSATLSSVKGAATQGLPTERSLWVSTTGKDINPGSAEAPLRTIQEAVNRATPGTAIFVEAGTYYENLVVSGKYNSALTEASPARPIALVSIDGQGAAQIRGRLHESGDPARNQSTIKMLGTHDFIVEGFDIIGNAADSHDEGPVKIVGGETYYNASGNIYFLNNIFSGSGVDAIKVTKTKEIHVYNNVFDGVFKEQVSDFVMVADSGLGNNTVTGRSDSGVAFKGGSTDSIVIGNHFKFASIDGRGPAIKVGGEGFNNSLSEFPAELRGFEAKNILVEHNVVENSGAYSVVFQGGQESIVRYNFFDNAGEYAIRSSMSRSSYGYSQSKDNRVSNNILDAGLKLLDVQSGTTDSGSAYWSNVTGILGDAGFDYGAGPVEGSGSAQEGGVVLEIRAGGTGTESAPPAFTVKVDGVAIGSRVIGDPVEGGAFDVRDDTLFETFTFSLQDGMPERVDIVFTNDGLTDGVNRNLVVDYIALSGERYEAEIDGFFTPNNGRTLFEGPRERLFVNGVLSFDDLIG